MHGRKNIQMKEKSGLKRFEWLAKENNVKIQTEIVESTMSTEGTIVKYAEENNVNAIVIGTRGMSGFAKQLLGRYRFRSCNLCPLYCYSSQMRISSMQLIFIFYQLSLFTFINCPSKDHDIHTEGTDHVYTRQ